MNAHSHVRPPKKTTIIKKFTTLSMNMFLLFRYEYYIIVLYTAILLLTRLYVCVSFYCHLSDVILFLVSFLFFSQLLCSLVSFSGSSRDLACCVVLVLAITDDSAAAVVVG